MYGKAPLNKRLLRWLTIILPVTFTVSLLLVTDLLFPERASLPAVAFALVLLALGTSAFSAWVFNAIDQREAENLRHSIQLEALNQASLALTTELELSVVLQKVVDLSKQLVGARYGALGVLDEEGQAFEQFITSGIGIDDRATIGHPPRGVGLFSVLLADGQSLRVDDIEEHPKSAGFPSRHPPMKSLLGVPIVSKGRIIGDLYVADRLSRSDEAKESTPFDEQDQQMLEMFANQAAIAIENATLYRQVQQLAVLEERERFGMDLHDGIIQSIYAVGLMLEDVQRKADDIEGSRNRIGGAIQSLNQVIRDLRNYILHLRPQHFQGRDILQGIEELGKALRANTFMDVQISGGNINPKSLTSEQTEEVLHIVQEALTNIQKHARASQVSIIAEILDNRVFQLTVENDGIPFEKARAAGSSGHGLKNMKTRAKSLEGEVEISPIPEGGTRVVLRVPLKR